MTDNDPTISTDGRTALASFMRFFAHELGNPVATIRMSSEMLLGGVPGELHQQLSQMVLDEAMHLERLIEAAVYFASLSTVARSTTEIGTLVEQAVGRRAEQIQFDVEHKSGPIDLSVDVAQVARMLDELLCNAVEAGASVVRITTSRGDSGAVDLTIASNGDRPVADPPSRIFDPFYTTREGRLGLGASIARRIAELHGGSVSVRLGDDGLTELTIRFPA